MSLLPPSSGPWSVYAPYTSRRPLRGFRARRDGSRGVACGLGERGEQHQRLGQEGIGVGVVVAEACFEELDVVAEDAKGVVTFAAAQEDIGQFEGLELLDLRVEGDGLFHQPLGRVEVAAEVGAGAPDAPPRRGTAPPVHLPYGFL